MGVDLHITRAASWCYSEENPITISEWLSYIEQDNELELADLSGEVIWRGKSKYTYPWLAWSEGQIYTKYPDSALYRKMLQIASSLDAHIEDDDGKHYLLPTDWEFDPSENTIEYREPHKPEKWKLSRIWENMKNKLKS